MDYITLNKLDQAIKMQLQCLDIIEKLITFDSEFVATNPTVELPPIENIGVLKSHFITQRKASQSVLSLTARHLPRLKIEHDKKAAEKKVTATTTVTKNNKKPITQPPTIKELKIPIENPQIISAEFISLF